MNPTRRPSRWIALSLAFAASATVAGGMGFHEPSKIVWKDGPGSLPPGAKFAVLEGDPGKDGPFVMRLKFPDGYRIAPHMHPKTERLTVISGTFNLGMGEKVDDKTAHRMPAGTYGYWADGMVHYAFATGETVVQLHGIGPWGVTYVNPQDDPRRKH